MHDPVAPRDVTGDAPPIDGAVERGLAGWAAAQPASPPYDFAEFERRAARRSPRRGLTQPRVAALAASVSALLLGAVLWQRTGPAATGGATSPQPAGVVASAIDDAAGADVPGDGPAFGEGRAVVRVRDAALRAEVQDHIALLDALLSEATATGDRGEPLQQLRNRRDHLADSLERVAWADSLSAP